ncbi:thermostable hemolysin [Vitiosangium sp. GDMCC 1.1324]|uniref:thermostable hemolysin n=1 Tax=Vitiosangium sp. (strain GDMCC 1.1324) TaxID=2138576 RepID=UPI000D3D2059|nr:thermostable hemolysin [Vitiosangium sp. GDMCC 1.1324]PTL76230.1 hypothetical protein DAT35_50185 [Vitiosangium sp. GDMCC 1.1324]
MDIRIIRRDTDEWAQVISLAQRKYKRAFEASVEPTPDCFVACYARREPAAGPELLACVGLTFGASGKFFAEQYLDEPIEQILAAAEQQPVSRESIVEVGTLASVGQSAGTELLRILPMLLWCMKMRYVLCTATRQLRMLFDALGYPFESVVAASVTRLDDEEAREKWGRYYENQPETGFVKLELLTGHISENVLRYQFSRMARKTPPQPQPQPQEAA